MRKSRYVVMNQDGGWQIRNAYRHVTSIFPSKAQALSAAIELAEKDGEHGHAPEVLVRHEDDRFITEWVYGNAEPGIGFIPNSAESARTRSK